MKRKFLLIVAMIAVLICAFALTASAAEPDTSRETVTLDDGTKCAIWDTDGNPLHWYVVSESEGVKTYAHIAANDPAVDYNNGWSGGDQLGTMKITVGGVEYTKSSFAVVNLYGTKITSGQRVGNEITRFSKTFTSATNLEYAYVPAGTTTFGAEDFKNCSNLKYVNLEDLTELTSIGSQSFNGCPKLFDGQTLDLTRTKLVSTAGNAFATNSFTNVKFPEETFTSLGSETFKQCKKLETVTGTKNATFGLGNYSFQECKKLKQVDGLIENGVLTIPEGTASIGTFTFNNCDEIIYIDLPSTLTYVGQQGFSYMDKVKLIDFGKITGVLTLNNCGHFRGLTSLVAVSLPEGMIEVSNRAFADCTNLTAVYMPNSIKYLSSNGSGQGSFCNSSSMYFVQQSFTVSQCLADGVVDATKLVLPEKPDVYFMPTSLETFTGHRYHNDTWSNATMFKNCTSINSVLVFPESFTVMTTMRPFEGMGTSSSPKTLVFLGDITSFSISHQNKYVTFVFANANDKSFDDLGVVRTTGNLNEANSYAYFCASNVGYNLAISGRVGSGQDPTTEENVANIATTIAALQAETNKIAERHFSNPLLADITEATCLTARLENQTCFCGTPMGEVELGEALGHNHDLTKGATITDILFKNGYTANGCKEIKCSRCDEKDYSSVVEALFNDVKYSVSEKGFGICVKYNVNKEAVAVCKDAGKAVSFGVVAIMADNVDGNGPLANDGKLATEKNVIAADVTADNLRAVTLRISGDENTWKSNATKAIYVLGYATNGTDLEYLGTASDAQANRNNIASVKSIVIGDFFKFE